MDLLSEALPPYKFQTVHWLHGLLPFTGQGTEKHGTQMVTSALRLNCLGCRLLVFPDTMCVFKVLHVPLRPDSWNYSEREGLHTEQAEMQLSP